MPICECGGSLTQMLDSKGEPIMLYRFSRSRKGEKLPAFECSECHTVTRLRVVAPDNTIGKAAAAGEHVG